MYDYFFAKEKFQKERRSDKAWSYQKVKGKGHPTSDHDGSEGK